jgi:2-polyprenyl-6-methoxyphenol hydroxylase-like FAD-dependent oxidoreductase
LKQGVIIAGGGLAGLALGLGLRRRGVPVTLHEAASYPRHRVCGEFISGVGEATLDALDLTDDLADAARHRSVVWYRKGRKILEDELPVPALGISRHRLDQRLAARLRERGGEVVEDSRFPREPKPGVVWAAGRIPAKGGWVGLKCHLQDFPMSRGLEMHLGSNGYLGLSPVEDGRVNACGLFRVDRSLRAKGSDLLLEYLRRGGHEALAGRMQSARRDEDSFLGVAGFRLGWQTEEPGVCAIGDAAGMIPPFTGNGMSMALESSELALEPIAAWSGGSCEWSEVIEVVRRDARRRFRRRLTNAMAIHRVLLHGAGQQVLEWTARSGLLPFRPLLSLVR